MFLTNNIAKINWAKPMPVMDCRFSLVPDALYDVLNWACLSVCMCVSISVIRTPEVINRFYKFFKLFYSGMFLAGFDENGSKMAVAKTADNIFFKSFNTCIK